MNSICCFSIEHTILKFNSYKLFYNRTDNRKCCRTSSICCVSIEFVQVTHTHNNNSTHLHTHARWISITKMRCILNERFGIKINSPDSEPIQDVRSIVWPIPGNLLWPHSPAIPWVSGVQSTIAGKWEIGRKREREHWNVVISSIGAATVNKLNSERNLEFEMRRWLIVYFTHTHSQSLLGWASLHDEVWTQP